MLMVSVKNLTSPSAHASCSPTCHCNSSPGKVTALISPNGSGKTTLLRTIIGEIQPERARVVALGARVGTCHRGV